MEEIGYTITRESRSSFSTMSTVATIPRENDQESLTAYGWFYRFASSICGHMSSISTNNGLEGTNNIIKKEYTQRELLGISRFLLLVEKYVHERSVDPERKEPVRVPTIPENVNCNIRKTMEGLKSENRVVVYLEYNDEQIWLIGSKDYGGDAEGLVMLWKELDYGKELEENGFTYSSWQQYRELRSFFYTLKKSACFAGFMSCTCPEGMKDNICKHVLMLMESEKLISPLPQPLEGRQRRVRRRKVGYALERI